MRGTCETCIHSQKLDMELICVCEDSEAYGIDVMYNDWCECWEEVDVEDVW